MEEYAAVVPAAEDAMFSPVNLLYVYKNPLLCLGALMAGKDMASFLDFQYKLSRKLPSRPLGRLFSADRQISALWVPTFQSNCEEMRRVFRRIDADGDGVLSRADLLPFLGKMGTAADMVDKVLWAADGDGDGVVGFKDFMEIQKNVSANDIRAAFQHFDADGDGRISAADLYNTMDELGEACTAAECRRIVRSVDKSGDGLVDMDDFMSMMTATLKPL